MKRKITIGILIGILFFICMPTLAKAEEKKVRVGYFLIDLFQEIDEDGKYSGYSYEYYKEISQNTGWEYEFVQAPYMECLEMLENGELDIVNGIEKTPEREEKYEFSEFPITATRTELYTLAENQNLYYENIEKFNGIKVGLTVANQQTKLLDDYCEKNKITFQRIAYSTQEEMLKGLKNGEVDAIFSGSIENLEENRVIARFEEIPLYFATAKGDPLIKEIDKALLNIKNEYPYFKNQIDSKYQDIREAYHPSFTEEEMAYIKSNPKITVVYNPDWPPIEYYDEETKEYKGISADVLKKIESYSGLQFEYYTSEDFEESIGLINTGKADIMASLRRDYNWADQNNLYLSSPYMNISIARVGKKSSFLKDGSIAILEELSISEEIEKQFPKEKIKIYASVKECLDAVKREEVESAYINNYVTNYYLSTLEYNSLYITQLSQYKGYMSVGISKDADKNLLPIMNKALLCFTEGEKDKILTQNTMLDRENAVKEFLYMNPIFSISMITLIGALVITILSCIIYFKTKDNKLIKHIAEFDFLTQVYNRATVEKKIEESLIREDSEEGLHAILSLDLDNFKKVNDTYGHPEGDKLLKEVAKTLERTVAEGDIVGRMGGDEFLIYINGIKDRKDMEEKAGRICEEIQKMTEQKERWSGVSISVGISLFTNKEQNFEKLYKEADKALYRRKENGRNGYEILNEVMNGS